MEIYARVPLIPQPLLMSGLDSQIDHEDLGDYYNGTLVSGEHRTKATLWPMRWGIVVGHPFPLALWNVDNLQKAHVSHGFYLGNFVA